MPDIAILANNKFYLLFNFMLLIHFSDWAFNLDRSLSIADVFFELDE